MAGLLGPRRRRATAQRVPSVPAKPLVDRDLSREVGPAQVAADEPWISRRLFERLRREDVVEVGRRAAAAPELAGLPQIGDDPATDSWLALHLGVFLAVPGVLERTGLPGVQPGEDVHAMARGPLAAAGGLYEADMVAGALRSAGADIAAAGDALDFGCSSGRVLRVLAAAHPEVRWRGCDPNQQAIAWLRHHLPQLECFVSPQEPPLALAGQSLGLIYAISIWSHFAPGLGRRWLEEMHRLLVPGGHLVLTIHGLQSIAYYAQQGLRTDAQCLEIRDSLYRQGFWYAAEFGAEGDEGVINPEWGTAFFSAEWLLGELCPRWRVVEFAAGRNQSNQDVYVLEPA